MLTAIPCRPMCCTRTSALSLNANSTLSTRAAVPCTTQGDALVLQPNELEYLSAGDHYGVNQIKGAGVPQPGDFRFTELPEFLLIDTVQPCDLQGRFIIQHDIEHDRRQQIQGQQRGNELLS